MPLQGLIGTDKFTVTGERPEDYRQGILYLLPNGSGPLTALISILPSKKTTDPKFHWFERAQVIRTVFINFGAGYNAAATTFVIDNGAGADPGRILRNGTVIKNMRTKEQMLVTVDQAAGTGVTVERAFGSTAAAAILDDDELRVIGNASAEGANVPTAIRFEPTERNNQVQIFRTPLSMTNTARMTELRTDSEIKKAKREAYMMQIEDMEFSFMWGEMDSTVDGNGQVLRSTRGLVPFIEQFASGNDVTATGGTLNEDELLAFLEPIFRYGSTEKLAFVGSTALTVLNQIAKAGTQQVVDAGTEVHYGMRLRRFVTALGDLMLRQHPLFNGFADWRKTMVVFDQGHAVYRYLRDLDYYKHRQNPGQDARIDEFLVEAGLEFHHPTTHGILRNVATFGA